MTVLGGHLGGVAVDAAAAAAVKNWKVSTKADLKGVVSTASSNATQRVVANVDWEGSFDGVGHTPVVKPGQEFAFVGAFDTSAGTKKGVSGNAICDSVTIKWDQEGGAEINWSAKISGDGALTIGTVTMTADATVSQALPSKGCLVKVGAIGGSPAAIDDVRSVELTITAKNSSYASTSTAGVFQRVPGPWDFTLSIGFYTGDITALPQPDDIKEVQLFVDGSLYWSLKWVMFSDISDVDTDIESGKVIGGTLNGGMDGSALVTAVWTKGEIKAPGAVVWW